MQKVHFNGRGFDYRSRKAQNYAYLTRFFYLYAIRYRIRYSIRYRSVGRVHLHEPLKDKRNEIAVLRMISIRLASMWILENFHVSYQVSLVPNKLLCKGSFIRTQNSLAPPPKIDKINFEFQSRNVNQLSVNATNCLSTTL